MPETITTRAPDDPDGTTYTLAPADIAAAICRRFERRPVVLHPTEPNKFIYDPGNFWDGPTHVTFHPDRGTFSFTGWDGYEEFPLVGPLH
jgi:hypothetical protein